VGRSCVAEHRSSLRPPRPFPGEAGSDRKNVPTGSDQTQRPSGTQSQAPVVIGGMEDVHILQCGLIHLDVVQCDKKT
jgi:hypothetical protein